MKVRSVMPGQTSPWFLPNNTQAGWVYYVMMDGNAVRSSTTYPNANAAKQAMREQVSFLRRKHCL